MILKNKYTQFYFFILILVCRKINRISLVCSEKQTFEKDWPGRYTDWAILRKTPHRQSRTWFVGVQQTTASRLRISIIFMAPVVTCNRNDSAGMWILI